METKIKGDKIKEGSILPEALGFDSFPMFDNTGKFVNKSAYTSFSEQICAYHQVLAYVTPETPRGENICQLDKGRTHSFGGNLFSAESGTSVEYMISDGTPDKYTRIELDVSEDNDGKPYIYVRDIINDLNLDFKIPITYGFLATQDNKMPITLEHSPFDYYKRKGGKLFYKEDAYLEYMVASVDYIGNPATKIPTYTNIESNKWYSWDAAVSNPMTMNWFYGIINNHAIIGAAMHININGEDLSCEISDDSGASISNGEFTEYLVGTDLYGDIYINPNNKTFKFVYE